MDQNTSNRDFDSSIKNALTGQAEIDQKGEEKRDLERRILEFLSRPGVERSMKYLKQEFMLDRRTIDKALQRLRKRGLITFQAPLWEVVEKSDSEKA